MSLTTKYRRRANDLSCCSVSVKQPVFTADARSKCSHVMWRFTIRQNSGYFQSGRANRIFGVVTSSELGTGDWRLERRSWRMGVKTDEAVTRGAKRAREWCHVRTICARVPASARACEPYRLLWD